MVTGANIQSNITASGSVSQALAYRGNNAFVYYGLTLLKDIPTLIHGTLVLNNNKAIFEY